ncbi:transmembrane protein 82 isoform X2 [Clupea harengus]|uniref:Transmembrane protein 82 isoform X2 n=1 Tax=Clupea harengus TaxID=7950 RepID=A0A6P3VUC2_CLUHA|nr:transmembrane protein 82 isoform X2 [Clupea harengus]
MLSFLTSLIPSLPSWLLFEISPVDSFLQGIVGACGISVLCSLLRIHVFIETDRIENDKDDERKSKQRTNHRIWPEAFQFWFLTGILAVVGSRVASLVVLEFSLRAISARVTSGPNSNKCYTEKLLVQCQFSMGCALSCSLHFLHKEAPHRWLSLLLASALSWFLASQCSRLHQHVKALFHLHSSQRYCGICIGLLTSGCSILPYLCCLLILTFAVAGIAALTSINQQFLSVTEALRFWTPLTICYTLLVVYMQEDQQRQPSSQTALQTVVVRLGGLMVLMLTVGQWADMFHVLVCFLGEAACLIPTGDLLNAKENGTPEVHRNEAQRRDHRRHLKDNKHE